uniref:Putative adenylate/guanylate cyclase protein n=1 Tax=uncultured marine microorganism TaxID=415540 RepID=A5CFV3_9ZZZZ|nr:putative adenylate/guanylate cyclase protein [uncultured marine microorganism]
MSSFFTELKRRNVLRVAAAYGVVAWIIIEAGSVLLPTFGASESAFQVYVVVVLAGFLLSLILAWVFEVTPEGVKLEKNVDRSESTTLKTGRTLDLAIIGLLIVALGISVTLNVTGMRFSDRVSTVDANRLSIAVLPFESRSADPDNVFFADGIHDDLLTMLGNINSLRVISRTSVMEYRDTKKNMRKIGEELGVTTILEGAVQKAGDNVRINVQLIDTNADQHLWAQSYDRQLTTNNIFAIQSEISAAIASALQATLTPEESARLDSVPTENLEAYNLCLVGRNNIYSRRLDNLQQARQQFERAIELDPNYAKAYSGLSDSVMLILSNHKAISTDEAFPISELALDKAVALDSSDADIYASVGLYKMELWKSQVDKSARDAAHEAFERALKINPNHVQALMWQASLYDESETSKSIELYERAIELDPLARVPQINLGVQYAHLGQNDAALRQWLKTIDLHPDWPAPYTTVAIHLAGLGRLDESMAWFKKAGELSTDPLDSVNAIMVYLDLGQPEVVGPMIDAIPDSHPLFMLAQAHKLQFEKDYAGASEILMQEIEQMERPPTLMVDFVADNAFLAKDYTTAFEYYELIDPELAADPPVVEADNLANAVAMAYTLQQLHQPDRARQLLEVTLASLETRPRMGMTGFGPRDAQILALMGRSDEAIAKLQEAYDEGWRSSWRYDTWSLEDDRYLESVHDRPEFQAIVEALKADLKVMGDRALAAEESNDWDELRDVAAEKLATRS